ncbi:glycosyltransferase family 2 protein [Olivibacter sitiensis]|uniref:glycosyltransferase family 2 protein n=1 Tax=Olivibacter sitiensis TaxID=376470 RepID=UPI0003FAFF5D|nr:glycosyltransferase [Olivibacter sitiensis]
MHINIDIIIPSFRLEDRYILPILNLPKPDNASFTYYLVVDNPNITPSRSLASHIANRDDIVLHINEDNKGAAKTRNIGIELGNSEWLLFLDDDIQIAPSLLFEYVNAIKGYPHEIGFIGLVKLPEPINAFTQAILVNGSMSVFSIAEKEDYFAWGATANILIRRKSIGNIRFSNEYPKFGGGEDVDFFLKVRDNNNYKNYKTLKKAVVYHPWWHSGKVDLQRPFRYGVGNSYLGQHNSRYIYYDFPNSVETLCLLAVMALITVFFNSKFALLLFSLIPIMLLIDVLALAIQLTKRKEKVDLQVLTYIIVLRLAYQMGLLMGNLSRYRLKGIGERFDYFGKPGRNAFFKFNTYKITKWILYFLLAASILMIV